MQRGDTESRQGSELMRIRLAEAAKQCLKTTSVDRLTVSEIVSVCGIARQTFYRNFLDKYDLINWYFDKLVQVSFAEMGRGSTVREGLIRKFRYIEKERVFFTAAFRSDAQNSLKEHDFELILNFYKKEIEQRTQGPLKPDLQFILELYCRGSVYMTAKWVLSGMKESPEELAAHLVEAMPGSLAALFRQFNFLEEISRD